MSNRAQCVPAITRMNPALVLSVPGLWRHCRETAHLQMILSTKIYGHSVSSTSGFRLGRWGVAGQDELLILRGAGITKFERTSRHVRMRLIKIFHIMPIIFFKISQDLCYRDFYKPIKNTELYHVKIVR